jgi:hypothetical protein
MRARHLLVVAVTLAAFAAAPAVAGAASRSFGGETGDGEPIVVSADSRSGKIDRLIVMFNARCRSGQTYAFGSRFDRVGGRTPLRVEMLGGGRFRATAALTRPLADGRVGRVGVVASGRVRRRSVTGAVSAAITVGPPEATEPEDTCGYRSTFSAGNQPGRILTGQTSQELPLVIKLDARARNVRVFHVGWSAVCEPPGFIQIGDDLVRFPIRSGRFGDEFDYTLTRDDGTVRTFEYVLRGRASRRRASGTLAVGLEDVGGPQPGTCRTGTVTWRAS